MKSFVGVINSKSYVSIMVCHKAFLSCIEKFVIEKAARDLMGSNDGGPDRVVHHTI